MTMETTPDIDDCNSRMSYYSNEHSHVSEEVGANYSLIMSKREKSRIRMFRVMVGGMLLMTAAVTLMAYFLLSDQETKNFETAYYQFSRSLGDAALDQQRSLRYALKSLSNEVTAYAQINNRTWPYVALPLFESFAIGYFDHSAGEFVGVNNLVTDDERDTFIKWSTKHYRQWLHESHMIQYGNLDLLNTDLSKYQPYVTKKTKEGFSPDDIRPYYSIRTSQSPPMRAYGPMINLNIASIGNNGQLIDAVFKLRNETLVTALKPFNALPPEEHQNFHTDSNADNPHSFMYAPIYERVHDPTSKIVGTVTSSVAWDASMQHLLPANVRGILCVVKNNCDQSFTYEVSGPYAYYLGKGDQHDPEHDYLEVEVDLSLHSHPNFTTTPGHCQYSMHIYPTNKFKSVYKTAMPQTFSIVVFATFFSVAAVFFVYDSFVKKRNKELAMNAAKSDKLVASLFPGEIKDRILARQSVVVPGGGAKNKKMMSSMNNAFNTAGNTASAELKLQPLAMEYAKCTIFFGDLSGFTAWSANRTPEQVFELLETLYSAFDVIAKRRRVFKVETIGDCYVAATGLPEPQKDHAVRMLRFATDCMNKMNILTTELEESLGQTVKLKLRVGLHSGSVTGGVLKGDKSRFQLFGDTMNTASRMESNGVPGKIHISQDTYNELVSLGKLKWCTPREDKIVAKGKGQMDTYWAIAPASSAQSTVSLVSSDQ